MISIVFTTTLLTQPMKFTQGPTNPRWKNIHVIHSAWSRKLFSGSVRKWWVALLPFLAVSTKTYQNCLGCSHKNEDVTKWNKQDNERLRKEEKGPRVRWACFLCCAPHSARLWNETCVMCRVFLLLASDEMLSRPASWLTQVLHWLRCLTGAPPAALMHHPFHSSRIRSTNISLTLLSLDTGNNTGREMEFTGTQQKRYKSISSRTRSFTVETWSESLGGPTQNQITLSDVSEIL